VKLFIFSCSVLLSLAGPVGAGLSDTEYYAVFMEGHKIGHSVHVRDVQSGKVTTTDELNMVIGRGGVSMAVKTVERSIETTDGKPIGFAYTQDLSGMSQKMTGKINEQGKLEVAIMAAGMSQQQTIDWPKDALMAEGMRLLELKKGMTEGVTYEAAVFSSALLSAVEAKVRVGPTANIDLFGRVLALTEVNVSMMMQGTEFTSISYVDKDLRAQKTVMPMMGMNLELIACDKAFALSDNDVVDFLGKMLVQSPVLLKDIRSKDSATYHLMPTGGKKLSIPSTDNQTVQQTKKGSVIVTVRPQQAAAGVKFPYKGSEAGVLEALKPTPYLQSDNKEIKALARKAVGKTRDAAKAVHKIGNFVNEYISEKNLSIGYASAAEVAGSRQGDCTEHAVLTAAMCRAVGIPAQVVCGIVYIEEFDGKKSVFGGHAWVEAYVGGKWIGLDATRAPNGFGAGHITMAVGNGDPTDFFSMASTLGYFKIEKVTLGK
jgi:hypothetical protein